VTLYDITRKAKQQPPKKKISKKQTPHLPNHHHPPTPPRQPLRQKPVHHRKPPQQILVFDIIDLDMQMLVTGQQCLVERRAQGGDDVRDVGGFEGLGGAQGEEAAGGLVWGVGEGE
jgi:hypothetical protein